MPIRAPKTNWAGLNTVSADDMNRIELWQREMSGGWLSTDVLYADFSLPTFLVYSEVKADADINAATDAVVTLIDIATGTPVSWTGAAPTGLSINTTYYAVRVDATHIKFCTSLANAYAGTPVVDITAVGSGTRKLNVLDRIVPNLDLTASLQKGFPIKFTSGGTVRQNVIYAITSTLITLCNMYVSVEADSICANTGGSVTGIVYSPFSRPFGSPEVFKWTPQFTASGSMTFTGISVSRAEIVPCGCNFRFDLKASGTTGGTANLSLYASMPPGMVSSQAAGEYSCLAGDTASAPGYGFLSGASLSLFAVRKTPDGTNWGLGASRSISFNTQIRI